MAVGSLAFVPAQPTLRAASISIGQYVLIPDVSTQWMWIRVTGPGEQVSRATVAAQIGDGGAFNGGSDTRPRFAGVSSMGGMFYRDSTAPQVTNHGLVQTVDLARQTGTVRALGELTSLLIDTTGVTAPGSYPFRLTNVAPNAPGPPLNTQLFDASGAPVPLSVTNGSIFVTFYGDVNLDARMDGSDFAVLARNFGKSIPFWDGGNFNKDGRVDGSDFALLAANFGRSAGPSAAISATDAAMLSAFADAHAIEGVAPVVLEPGAAAAFAGAAALLTLSRRRFKRPAPGRSAVSAARSAGRSSA
jgi:hypothetical protein